MLAVLILSRATVLSQGFDWEYSVRLPFHVPTFFVGPTVSYASISHFNDQKVLEQISQNAPAYICAQFDKGHGSAMSFGAQAQWWVQPRTSVSVGLLWNSLSADFSADAPAVVLTGGKILKTQYTLSTSIQYLRVEVRAKQRLLGMISGQFALGTDLKISDATEQHEVVLEPSGYVFPGTSTQDKLLSNKDLSGSRALVVLPGVGLSYDVDLGFGRYAEPYCSIEFPLMSYSAGATWSSLNYKVGISVLFGIRMD